MKLKIICNNFLLLFNKLPQNYEFSNKMYSLTRLEVRNFKIKVSVGLCSF